MRSAWLKIALLLLPSAALADPRADYAAALSRWQAANVRSYTFEYRATDGFMVAPRCAGALIRTYVHDGVPRRSTVVAGDQRCPAGSRLPREANARTPRTIDEVFASVEHLLKFGPEQVKLEVAYHLLLGYPTRMSAKKLILSDSDEGFEVKSFAPQK